MFNLDAKKNTAYGDNALKNNKSNQNSAFGFEALELNTIGYQNTIHHVKSNLIEIIKLL